MEPTDDHQLNNFMQQIQAEAQKQGLQEQMLSLNSRCFDICFADSRPPSKMDGKSQTCLANCVNRIFDAKQFMFEHLQKSSPAGAI
uniref:Mitochondrial import inner membrane translocase subunit n=1 Tax=Globodera pallida TaxID=36090 RepID=A0A183C2F6_GLOPA